MVYLVHEKHVKLRRERGRSGLDEADARIRRARTGLPGPAATFGRAAPRLTSQRLQINEYYSRDRFRAGYQVFIIVTRA
ncbi:hypothetical protein EVAR_103945_1 [Eumeta japonica]|uniref:Uncharacterized protein n=1 Tax=Eumeta variegata TaxID=151549 RepID=A0A4C1YFA3_EUMVA|nr:hypothetical protein EVAR_103945_1 [Eumeta japonica]